MFSSSDLKKIIDKSGKGENRIYTDPSKNKMWVGAAATTEKPHKISIVVLKKALFPQLKLMLSIQRLTQQKQKAGGNSLSSPTPEVASKPFRNEYQQIQKYVD